MKALKGDTPPDPVLNSVMLHKWFLTGTPLHPVMFGSMPKHLHDVLHQYFGMHRVVWEVALCCEFHQRRERELSELSTGIIGRP